MIKSLVQAAKEQPKEFLTGTATLLAIFGALYVGLWLAAALG